MLLRLLFCTLKFLLSSLSVWLLFVVIFDMWVFHFRSDSIVIPRYLALVVVTNTWPWRVYSGTIGFLFTGMVIFLHFVGLNFINQCQTLSESPSVPIPNDHIDRCITTGEFHFSSFHFDQVMLTYDKSQTSLYSQFF